MDGIGAVLSLNDGELVRASELDEVGIAYCCIPLSDAAPPLPGDSQICVNALPRALSFALRSIENHQSVLVHCSSGKDRTGMFLAYYLCATESLTPSEAIREVRRLRPIALSAEGWEKLAYQVLGQLTSG